MHYSPLRYPGGKAQLIGYFQDILNANNFIGGHYVEPYAGGAGIAINLLITGASKYIHLNDLNYPLYCFWSSVLNNSDELCENIIRRKVSVNTWKRQKRILKNPNNYTQTEIGYAVLFLNRTNRSGIIKRGGVIGGINQDGAWKIDARFNKEKLIEKIIKIASLKEFVSIHNLDAKVFLKTWIKKLPKNTLVYLDPPYYKKGQRLYDNFYQHNDHEEISRDIDRLKKSWIVSYDNVPEVANLYKKYRTVTYSLNYSAAKYYKGSELMIFSNNLFLPNDDQRVIGRHG